ncbi:MAG TPA: SCP2 sterol-binding domain-containing protein [Jatrophihabitans sp.]|nr:SCP2 sterol-binding domain-containing protein [Jatrophihabitans sp.]
MATVEQCEQAFRELAERLATSETSRRKLGFDRSLTCTIRDLDVVFSGRLKDGHLLDIGRAATNHAQVRLTMNSDDLIELVDGHLKMGHAWATGRVRIHAGVRDLLRLRSLF